MRVVSPSLGLMEKAAFEAPVPMRFLCGQGLQPTFINNLQGAPVCAELVEAAHTYSSK